MIQEKDVSHMALYKIQERVMGLGGKIEVRHEEGDKQFIHVWEDGE